jgi:hypothetical protein
VLAQILPGIRHVRAPLIAGYILFAAVWLIADERFPTGDFARSEYPGFYSLEDFVGPLGVAAAVSVAAYLLGSLTFKASSALRRFVRDYLVDRFHHTERPPEVGDSMLELVGQEGADLDTESHEWGLFCGRLQMANQDAENMPEEGCREAAADDRSLNREGVDWTVVSVVRDVRKHTDDVAMNLLVTEHSAFAEYDRYRAEAELREAIAGPGMLLAVAIILNIDAPVGLKLVVLVIVVGLLTLLYIEGRQSGRLARKLLMRAVSQGIVDTRTLELLRASQTRASQTEASQTEASQTEASQTEASQKKKKKKKKNKK